VIQIVERRAAQIVSIYTTKPGGLYRAMEVAAVARAAGLICNVNGSVETGVGNLANLQLAAAAPAVVLSCVVPVSTPAEAQSGNVAGIYYKDDLITEPMRFVDGAIELPHGVGMGKLLAGQAPRWVGPRWASPAREPRRAAHQPPRVPRDSLPTP